MAAIAVLTLCAGERREFERRGSSFSNSSMTLKKSLPMDPVDMCVASICSFALHVNTAEVHTYSLVDTLTICESAAYLPRVRNQTD
jgi:hypothetical protein